MSERPPLITQAACARRYGVTRQAIGELVARHVLPLVDGKVDPVVADAVLGERLDPSRSKILRQGAPAASAPGAPAADAAPADTAARLPSFNDARAVGEHYRALTAQVEYQQLIGSLLPADAVRRAAFDKARIARDRLLGIPSRISAQLAVETDQKRVFDLLMLELQSVCAELAKGEPTEQRETQ